MRITSRVVVIGQIMVALALGCWPIAATAESEVKVSGLVDVLPAGPGGAVGLPLAPGSSPVAVLILLGEPVVNVAVQVTPATLIKAESGLPATLVDRDRVRVEGRVVDGIVQASSLEIEGFPEVALSGTVQDVPPAGIALPLAPEMSVSFALSLRGGAIVPVRLTSAARIDDAPATLVNGASVRVEGIARDFALEVTELEFEGNDDPQPHR